MNVPPIYVGLGDGSRAPSSWDGLEEMLSIADSLDGSSAYRRIPKKRRDGINNSGEWPLGDGRILVLRNTGSVASNLPAYSLDLMRPDGRGPEALVHSIHLADTDYMSLDRKHDAIRGLRHITSNARSALAAASSSRLHCDTLVRQATPAMLHRPHTAPRASRAAFNMAHRTPWQSPRDILDEDPEIEYRGPEGGIGVISVRTEPFLRRLCLSPLKMRVCDPSMVGPIERMAATQKLQRIIDGGRHG